MLSCNFASHFQSKSGIKTTLNYKILIRKKHINIDLQNIDIKLTQ